MPDQKNPNMLNILKFYRKIKNTLNLFKKRLKYVEIHSDLKNLKEEDYSFDYINFIINIDNSEYLLFLIDRFEVEITDDELDLFKNIFNQYTSKVGILITFNNENLDTISLNKNQIEKRSFKEMKIGVSLLKKLETLTTKHPIFFNKVDIKERYIEKKTLKKNFNEELINEFKKDINRTLPAEKKDFIRYLLNSVDLKEFDYFYDYYSKNREEIFDYIKKFVRRIENELHS